MQVDDDHFTIGLTREHPKAPEEPHDESNVESQYMTHTTSQEIEPPPVQISFEKAIKSEGNKLKKCQNKKCQM